MPTTETDHAAAATGANRPTLPVSAFVLVATNLLPLAGVLWGGWSVFPLLLLFWCENVLVGIFNVLRMVVASGGGLGSQVGKLFLIPFFTVHYGMFTLVHGIFVVAMFSGAFANTSGPAEPVASPDEMPAFVANTLATYKLGWPLLALMLSHGYSFFANFIASGEFRRVGAQDLMGRPYGRVVVLHVTILIGGFLALATGSHALALAVLIVLKIAVDLKAHLAERRILAQDA